MKKGSARLDEMADHKEAREEKGDARVELI
jgi:hypothetical protein